MNSSRHSYFRNFPALILVAFSLACVGSGGQAPAADQSITERAGQAAKDAKQTVEQAGQAAATKIEHLWQTIESQRIKNRKPDEIVAWVIMGLLVGGLAGVFSAYGTSGAGRAVNYMFGLVGAFIGGVLASLTQLDLGLGPVLIRYEELLLSFAGAVVIILGARWLRSRTSKKTAK